MLYIRLFLYIGFLRYYNIYLYYVLYIEIEDGYVLLKIDIIFRVSRWYNIVYWFVNDKFV